MYRSFTSAGSQLKNVALKTTVKLEAVCTRICTGTLKIHQYQTKYKSGQSYKIKLSCLSYREGLSYLDPIRVSPLICRVTDSVLVEEHVTLEANFPTGTRHSTESELLWLRLRILCMGQLPMSPIGMTGNE